MRKKLAAGNWKMNGSAALLDELANLATQQDADAPQVIICPPSPLLIPAVAATQTSAVQIGGQDCHSAQTGAHTGDVSAQMVKDTGASAVIVGHSERRADHAETNADIRAKVQAAWAANLLPILCIGESEAERIGPNTLAIIAAQLDASMPDGATGDTLVIAYEPIWAIGTGRVPTMDQIIETHDMIRAELTKRFGAEGDKFRILYGGSVKPNNAAEIFTAKNVDGALVGGASLKAADFQPIIDALQAS
ncbi:MAG: triose-phosphate isomerase [Tateyamaria sp.]|uniref:triose-phosphate isomerase n=1 Tax=Tateyamaria sp. TaxID=1929288 RepID=UPI00327A4B51